MGILQRASWGNRHVEVSWRPVRSLSPLTKNLWPFLCLGHWGSLTCQPVLLIDVAFQPCCGVITAPAKTVNRVVSKFRSRKTIFHNQPERCAERFQAFP